MRVEVGVDIRDSCSHSALRRWTVSFKVDSKQFFSVVTLIVTYEFIYCWYNSLFKQVVSGDRRAQSRGAGGVQIGNDR